MTQEFVTLPREVVEQTFAALKYEKDANNPLDWHHDKTMNALRAALEQSQSEQGPVGFVRQRDIAHLARTPDDWASIFGQATGYNIIPVYTHPQPKREPLSLAQIAEVFGWKPGYLPTPEQVHDARAIEAAHNIK